MVEMRLVKVSEIFQETHDTMTVRFVNLDGGKFSFKPGQFYSFYIFEEGKKAPIATRPYSISSSPLNDSYVDVTYKLAGFFTNRFHSSKVGDTYGIMGPLGSFVFEEKHKDIVLIAGGIGITPFTSMIDYITANKLGTKVTLLYSNKTRKDIAFEERLKKLNSNNIKIIFTLTREQPQGWQGELGRINEDMIRKYVPDLSKSTFFVCGSNEMVENVKKLLAGMGIPQTQIKFELFGPSAKIDV